MFYDNVAYDVFVNLTFKLIATVAERDIIAGAMLLTKKNCILGQENLEGTCGCEGIYRSS